MTVLEGVAVSPPKVLESVPPAVGHGQLGGPPVGGGQAARHEAPQLHSDIGQPHPLLTRGRVIRPRVSARPCHYVIYHLSLLLPRAASQGIILRKPR